MTYALTHHDVLAKELAQVREDQDAERTYYLTMMYVMRRRERKLQALLREALRRLVVGTPDFAEATYAFWIAQEAEL